MNRAQFEKDLSLPESMRRHGPEERPQHILIAARWWSGFVCPRRGVAEKVSELRAQSRAPTVYLDIALASGTTLTLPDLAAQRALYSVDAAFEVDGEAVPALSMLVLSPHSTPRMRAPAATRLVMVGGAPLGQRHMVWNFVSSRRERIVQAQADWSAPRFDPVPGETEFIPSPPARP
jgi:redox-sensitive bicupin YhaK (pirin superfamily)